MGTQKKLDHRITALIKNGVQQNKRSIFLIIGDHGRDHVVTLHYLLSMARVSARPSVLWCYKKDLGFSSNTKKRMKKIKRKQKKSGTGRDEDPLELFLTSTNVRYTYYKEVQNIMGNTYGMCVLQNFEALTPNILAQTIETVEGGGLIIFLIRTLKSLKQLYTMNMDIHSRYRTEHHADIVSRFNERFLLSLASNPCCLTVNDELAVLPISAGMLTTQMEVSTEQISNQELEDLKRSVKGYSPAFELVNMTRTLDQAKVVMNLLNILQDKNMMKTATLFASRGRGKSASLGIALAGAVAYGYNIMFVTSPSPENVKTLFEIFIKGLKELGYEEHVDYDTYNSTSSQHKKAITRVNIFKEGKQVVQWVPPTDSVVFSQAELLIIDEAAAIPLPMQSSMFGNYTTFISSTVNGYEGTGRALTVKLLRRLRENYNTSVSNATDNIKINDSSQTSVRSLVELSLNEPIRYSAGDSVEEWLNKLLCLDLCNPKKDNVAEPGVGCPQPRNCTLYHVNRDSLFSYHPLSEAFLRGIMSLFISSHYKNSPNDIQLLSDAPTHRIFVLIEDKKDGSGRVPDMICAIQVSFEGKMSKEVFRVALEKGVHSSGDTIPWIVAQHFQDENFSQLSGVRIVRIATRSEYMGMGYGKRSVDLLKKYLCGFFVNPSKPPKLELFDTKIKYEQPEYLEDTLHSEKICGKDISSLPPLLESLLDIKPPDDLSWLGVAYGLTKELQSFWRHSGFTNIYIRQTPNDSTGDNTCVMIQALSTPGAYRGAVSESWVESFSWDFRRRLVELCGACFRNLSAPLLLSVFDTLDFRQISGKERLEAPPLALPAQIYSKFTPHDLKRLKAFINNQIDHNGVLDLVQPLSRALFLGQIVKVNPNDNSQVYSAIDLSPVQYCLLLILGLQKRPLRDIQNELSLPSSQILALFKKAVKKCVDVLEDNIKAEIEKNIVEVAQKTLTHTITTNGVSKKLNVTQDVWGATSKTLDEDITEAVPESYRDMQKYLVSSLDVDEYAIKPSFKAPETFLPGSNALGVISVETPASEKKRKLDKVPVSALAADTKKQDKNKAMGKKYKKSTK